MIVYEISYDVYISSLLTIGLELHQFFLTFILVPFILSQTLLKPTVIADLFISLIFGLHNLICNLIFE